MIKYPNGQAYTPNKKKVRGQKKDKVELSQSASNRGMDLENDMTAIFYYYGYLGFLLYIGFIMYFIVMAIKLLIKNPIVLFSSKFISLSFTFALGIFGGEYSGALLRKSNANIYMALILVLYYIYISNKLEPKKLKENKLTFLFSSPDLLAY